MPAKAALLLLFTIILTLASEAVLDMNTISFGFPKENITRITGYAVTDSTNARYYTSRCSISLVECNIRSGAVSSARGIISVSFKRGLNVYAGDLVSFDGSFKLYGFSAGSGFVKSRPAYNKTREKFMRHMKSRIGVSDDISNLVAMLLLGVNEDPEYELSTLARSSGTSFVLALSGMHIGLISMLLSLVLKPLFGRRGSRVISLVLLSFYVFLIGPKPSLVRALILSLSFFVFSRLKGIENLMIAFLLQLLLFPSSAISMSAVFSYLSLAGILGFLPFFSMKIDDLVIVPKLLMPVIVSASAILYTVPYTYSVFGKYQLSALLTSALISMLIYIFMVLSIASFVLPFLRIFLFYIYSLIYFMMEMGSIVQLQSTLWPYMLFVISILFVLLLSCILSRRRGNSICGSLTMTVRKR